MITCMTKTFFVDPFDSERLFLAELADVLDLVTKSFVRDSTLKEVDENVTRVVVSGWCLRWVEMKVGGVIATTSKHRHLYKTIATNKQKQP